MVGELFFSHEVEDIKGSRGYDPRTSLERCLALVGALTGPMGNTAQVHDASASSLCHTLSPNKPSLSPTLPHTPICG